VAPAKPSASGAEAHATLLREVGHEREPGPARRRQRVEPRVAGQQARPVVAYHRQAGRFHEEDLDAGARPRMQLLQGARRVGARLPDVPGGERRAPTAARVHHAQAHSGRREEAAQGLAYPRLLVLDEAVGEQDRVPARGRGGR
jgi:hypothetical protein